jgi:predicted acyl esterase
VIPSEQLGWPLRRTDTDWFVELHDLTPDGRSLVVIEGVCRARYRHSQMQPEALVPGRTEKCWLPAIPADSLRNPRTIRLTVSLTETGSEQPHRSQISVMPTQLLPGFISARETPNWSFGH